MHQAILRYRPDAIFFLLAVVAAVLMKTMAETDPGIVAFELARTTEKVRQIFQVWGEEGVSRARLNVLLDFLFIPGYALFLFFFCLRLYYWRLHSFLSFQLVRLVAFMALAAGFLDILENLYLLQLLNGNIQSWLAASAFWLATFKFLLVLAPSIFALLGWIPGVFRKKSGA